MHASPGQVLRIAAPILVVSALMGWGVATLGPRAPVARADWLLTHDGLAAAETHLAEHVQAHPDDADAWRALVRQRGQARSLRDLTAAMKSGDLDQVPSEIELYTGAAGGPSWEERTAPALSDEAFGALLDKASSPSPAVLRILLRYYGDNGLAAATSALLALDGPGPRAEAARLQLGRSPDRALTLADEALQQGESEVARKVALRALSRLKRTDELERRLDDKAWRRAADPRLRVDVALEKKDPIGVLVSSTLARLENVQLSAHLAALVAGLCWAVVLLLLGGARKWTPLAKGGAAAAVLLGVVSGVLTLAAATWLNHSLGHYDRDYNESYLIAYYVLGVGFKEEAIKLLCFLPLIPLALRLKSDAAVLTLASLVGLGFAIEENTAYFARDGGAVVMGRYLTANFLHISFTGIAGYHLVLAIRGGGEHWNTFTTEFFKVVAVHGLYDYLLSTQLFDGASFFAMMAFVILSQWYLRLLTNMPRPGAPRSDRMIVYFTLALSLAVGTNLIFVASQVGLRAALDAIFLGVLGNALIAIMFYREL